MLVNLLLNLKRGGGGLTGPQFLEGYGERGGEGGGGAIFT